MGFKEDADFARFVSMGAIAAEAIRRDLTDFAHEVIELERYAMANKIWQTKVKRLRIPDLVCVRCGLRIEARGKSQLGIVVSHSDAEGRAWDGGMRDQDLYAFARVDTTSTPSYTSQPAYFRTSDLRATEHLAKQSNRKAISEGSELTLTWPTWVPAQSGTFVDVDSEGRLVLDWVSGRRYRYGHWRKWESRYLYVTTGAPVVGLETMVAGVAASPGDMSCTNDWDLQASLQAHGLAERYAAVKVAGILHRDDLTQEIRSIAVSEGDWRLRLEAMASLARLDPLNWTAPIAEAALGANNTDEHRLECVFVLSEILTDEAAKALSKVAMPDDEKPTELRAAAVWGLGQGVHPRPDLMLRHILDDNELVALHAIAGLPDLPTEHVPTLLEWIQRDHRHAATAAQVLQRHHAVKALLQAAHEHNEGRLWALRALGALPPELVRKRGGGALTADIVWHLEPIWIGQTDWLRGPGHEGLEALDVQKVRFNPLL